MSDSGTSTTRRLVLQPHPASPAAARRWIREQLHVTGHDDLAECAELATSELVTNAVLHARTTVTVVLDPRDDRCRIAILDLAPGAIAPRTSPDGQVWSSGRGLQILGAITRCWGVEEEPPGKQIWFEPRAVDTHDQSPAAAATPERQDPPPRLSARHVVLRHAPVSLLRQARQRLADMHREMLLISFTPPEDCDDPSATVSRDVPARLVELARSIEPITNDLFPDGLSAPDGDATLTCRFPRADVDVTGWPDLLDEADDYCRSEHLLTLAAPRREASARRWFLGEVSRQSSGLSARAWPDYVDGRASGARSPAGSSQASSSDRSSELSSGAGPSTH